MLPVTLREFGTYFYWNNFAPGSDAIDTIDVRDGLDATRPRVPRDVERDATLGTRHGARHTPHTPHATLTRVSPPSLSVSLSVSLASTNTHDRQAHRTAPEDAGCEWNSKAPRPRVADTTRTHRVPHHVAMPELSPAFMPCMLALPQRDARTRHKQ